MNVTALISTIATLALLMIVGFIGGKVGELYDISPGYAAELVGASTLFSPITIIPLVTFASFLAQHPLASLIA